MNILLLAEGDAETRDCWSGIAKSVVDHLRAAGHVVRTGDVELYDGQRWTVVLRTFSPNRARWQVRFRLGSAGFETRSRNAARHISLRRRDTDVIVQIGATFEPRGHGTIPYALYCDSNIRMAERGGGSGAPSWAAHLTDHECRQVRARETAVYRGASAIFTISDLLRQSFIDDFLLEPDCVHSIHAGPNLNLAMQVRTEERPTRDRPPAVLFVGRQFERKGGALVLEAFGRVRRQILDAELLVVGPADTTTVPGVRWLGYLNPDDPTARDRLAAAYAAADVFCLPTRFEPFGIVFLEAMGAALPCIGTVTGAVPEMIIDGKTGYTIALNDVDALTDRLLRLLGDRHLARTMGEAGRERARNHFTWEAVVGRMLEKLELIAARRQGCVKSPCSATSATDRVT